MHSIQIPWKYIPEECQFGISLINFEELISFDKPKAINISLKRQFYKWSTWPFQEWRNVRHIPMFKWFRLFYHIFCPKRNEANTWKWEKPIEIPSNHFEWFVI